MINIVDTIKELFTIKKAVTAVQKAPKSGFLTSEFWSLILTQGAAIYMGAMTIIPPVWGVGIGVGLSLIWLIARMVLKHKGMSLAPVAGIPDLDINGLVDLLAKKFPQIQSAEPEIKSTVSAVVAEIKTEPVVAS